MCRCAGRIRSGGHLDHAACWRALVAGPSTRDPRGPGVCGPSKIARLDRKRAFQLPHVLRCVACLTLVCHSGSGS